MEEMEPGRDAYTAEDYISLIEQGRMDKIGPRALNVIAKRFRRLQQREEKLDALECTGVDNWCGYDEAMRTLRELREQDGR